MLTIRSYEPTDQDAVSSLHRLVFLGELPVLGAGSPANDLPELLDICQAGHGCFLVGMVDARLVAFGVVLYRGGDGRLRDLCVHPFYRRLGYGRAMLLALEDQAVTHGLRQLAIELPARQTAPAALLAAHGYTERHRFLQDGVEVVRLQKHFTLEKGIVHGTTEV